MSIFHRHYCHALIITYIAEVLINESNVINKNTLKSNIGHNKSTEMDNNILECELKCKNGLVAPLCIARNYMQLV